MMMDRDREAFCAWKARRSSALPNATDSDAWGAATAAERERCAQAVDHILREGGGTWGDWLRAGRDIHDARIHVTAEPAALVALGEYRQCPKENITG